MPFRKPEYVPLLFIIVAVTVLATFGLWQVERLEWKRALLAEIETAQTQPVLEKLPPQAEGLAYRKAALSGRYLPEKTLHFIGNKSDGYVWLVPFKEKTSKQTLLVSAGWFPSNAKDVKLPEHPQGTLRPMRAPRLFSPENRPERNLWFSEDKAAMEAATGVALFPLVLDAKPMPPLRNDHLGYAITWFSLALVGIVMFIFYHRIPARKI